VLNAFRHHGVSRGMAFALWKRFPTRAQRLSASRSFAALKSGWHGANLEVLNAFRHHGVSRGAPSNAGTICLACSTPFGITEFRG